jgi:hypothetical protein
LGDEGEMFAGEVGGIEDHAADDAIESDHGSGGGELADGREDDGTAMEVGGMAVEDGT